ncbi:MAG: hypothetical protein Faunusvirus31_7 [Faunusvirus sp.]|uniref:Uncharacterized protein n=1 Tax=Faunusvirus sp. TaxID=2487766 RepID=A0A3G4ZXJ5_9VIRU|nr:MAG: hypothetical protein Faunusvirus31_7 [Faunusvirus sp.]
MFLSLIGLFIIALTVVVLLSTGLFAVVSSLFISSISLLSADASDILFTVD